MINTLRAKLFRKTKIEVAASLLNNGIQNPLDAFSVNDEKLLVNGKGEVPLTYWVNAPNFGDLLSPWIFGQLTDKKIELVRGAHDSNKDTLKHKAYISIGSIISRVQNNSIVWGTGSFGTEQSSQISKKAAYHAVRGPLTRCLVMNEGIECPKVYGDPALLVPFIYNPEVDVTHDIGVVIRWSEKAWREVPVQSGVKLIDLGRDDIEGVLRDIKSCKKIITSSLHGLIIADAYGLPNAWLSSRTPKGGEFKFYDYFISVDKVRHAHTYNVEKLGLKLETLNENFDFDSRVINFDYFALLNACPFLKRK